MYQNKVTLIGFLGNDAEVQLAEWMANSDTLETLVRRHVAQRTRAYR
jgi:hypothetical protein